MKFHEIDFSLKNIALLAGFLILCSLIYAAKSVLIVFVVSVLIAYLLNPAVEFFVKMKIPRFLGVLILVLFLVAILFAIVALFLPTFIKDITYIVSNMPTYINIVFTWIEKVLNYFEIEPSLDLESSKAFIMERMGVISKYILNTISSAAASVKGVAGVLINVFMVPVLVFFLLTDFPNFKAFTNKVVEHFNMQRIMEHLAQFETLVGKYFRGMFLVGFILSFLYSFVLWLVGVNYWFILGTITGFGAMIPYVGFTVGLISSLIAAAFTFHDFLHPLYVLIGYIIVQVLESMVITPKVVGDSLGLSPVVVIVGLMIGGALAGFLGMIIALPFAAFLKILLDRYVFKTQPVGTNTEEIEAEVTEKTENKEK